MLQQGQGMHGSFPRADTGNVMGAMGPNFHAGVESAVPASDADLGKSITQLLGPGIPSKGALVGRVFTESSTNGIQPTAGKQVVRSEPDGSGHVTILQVQSVGTTRHLDGAGYPGRTVGLDDRAR